MPEAAKTDPPPARPDRPDASATSSVAPQARPGRHGPGLPRPAALAQAARSPSRSSAATWPTNPTALKRFQAEAEAVARRHPREHRPGVRHRRARRPAVHGPRVRRGPQPPRLPRPQGAARPAGRARASCGRWRPPCSGPANSASSTATSSRRTSCVTRKGEVKVDRLRPVAVLRRRRHSRST